VRNGLHRSAIDRLVFNLLLSDHVLYILGTKLLSE